MGKADDNVIPVNGKTVSLDCDVQLARGLAAAVRAYAHAAYPPGGSECGQAARQALLEAADQCARHGGGPLVLRRRLLTQMRAAVRWCLSQEGPADVKCPPGLASVLAVNGRRS